MRCELRLGVCVVLSSASEYNCVQLMQSLQQITLTSASRNCWWTMMAVSWSGRKAQRCAVNSEVAAVDCVREGVTQVAVVSWPAKQTHREQEQCSFA